MESEMLQWFLNKKIVFHKRGDPRNLVGVLLSVSGSSVMVVYSGFQQVHALSEIIDVAEATHNENGEGRT